MAGRRSHGRLSALNVVVHQGTTNAVTAARTSLRFWKMRPWIACSLSVRFHRSATPFVSGSSTKPF